jgi:hypothetical protein
MRRVFAADRKTRLIKHAVLVFVLCFSIAPVFAQWSTDPGENNIITLNTLIPIMTTDMQNGVIVVGQTHPQYSTIFAQRVSVDGRLLWTGQDGVRVSTSPLRQWLVDFGAPQDEFVLSDGAGGCYVAYQLARFLGYDSTGESDFHDVGLYIQRLDAAGNRLFGSEGMALMSGEPDSTHYLQRMRQWILDDENGVYAIWLRLNESDPARDGIHIARISKMGEFVWGPKRLQNHFHGDYLPYLDAIRNLNLYCYAGESTPPLPDRFIKINASTGDIISEREIEIGVGRYGFNSFYDFCLSENASAVFAFRDFRTDTLRIQKLDSDGEKLWGESPVIVDTILYGYSDFDIESDRAGGAYILYKLPDNSFHLQHFCSKGERLWEKTFYSKLNMTEKNKMLVVAPDGDAFVLLEKIRYLYKTSYEGEHLWRTQVTTRDTIASTIDYFELIADEIRGCIVLWHEVAPSFYGFRAQRIDHTGKLGGPALEVEGRSAGYVPSQPKIRSAYPNPFSQLVEISVFLPRAQEINLSVFDLLGREVSTLQNGYLNNGEHLIRWSGINSLGQRLPAGIYFLVLQAGLTKQFHKILFVR